MLSPMEKLGDALRQNTLVRIIEQFGREHSDSHLKDLVIDEAGPGREIVVLGRRVINFGSDSFLGLDQDPRVQEAMRRGLRQWGTHNGSSRAFASVRANIDAEEKLADWLGVESVLIYPSVMLANLGAIPGLVGRQDAIASTSMAHSSMQEAAKIARANGTKVATFAHSDPQSLEQTLAGPPPVSLRPGLHRRRLQHERHESRRWPSSTRWRGSADAVLYIDDAHGTGVLGEHGRGTVLEALGSYDNAFVVGSLSKAFSCAGGFIGCSASFQRLLKIRSSPYVFGGPVVPCYLEAIGTVLDILRSDEYDALRARLDRSHRPPDPRAGRRSACRHGRGDADRLGPDRRRGRHA